MHKKKGGIKREEMVREVTSIISFKGWLIATEDPTVSQDLLPKETHSEAMSLVPNVNKTTLCGHRPLEQGEWLTLSIRAEEESEEQQQWPGCTHHPAAWQQHALAARNHCL